ncbi:MAG: tetratricopeptide repeat protein [Candidatus Limnocylindrales bacterium]
MIELLLEAERALSFGRVDRAEQLYRQVADADPKNSIAVVGLARVALERADDLGAYLLARRALLIDPENEAARRLAVRLEEVMRTRGDAVPDTPAVPVVAAPVDPAGRVLLDADGPGTGHPELTRTPEPPPGRAPTSGRSLLDRIRRRC